MKFSSGTNTSGSSYKVTSSYANGSLVRGTPHIAGTAEGTFTASTQPPHLVLQPQWEAVETLPQQLQQ